MLKGRLWACAALPVAVTVTQCLSKYNAVLYRTPWRTKSRGRPSRKRSSASHLSPIPVVPLPYPSPPVPPQRLTTRLALKGAAALAATPPSPSFSADSEAAALRDALRELGGSTDPERALAAVAKAGRMEELVQRMPLGMKVRQQPSRSFSLMYALATHRCSRATVPLATADSVD